MAHIRFVGGDAAKSAIEQLAWYDLRAIHARRMYRAAEIAPLALFASVPVVVLAFPGRPVIAATISMVVTTLVGAQRVFRWRDHYARFSLARGAINQEIGRYAYRLKPYDDAISRDRNLMEAVLRITAEEGADWGHWMAQMDDQGEAEHAALTLRESDPRSS